MGGLRQQVEGLVPHYRAMKRSGLVALILVAGCYLHHSSDPLDAEPTDTNTADAGSADARTIPDGTSLDGCALIGSHQPCGILCDRACPDGFACHHQSATCIEFGDALPARQPTGCDFPDVVHLARPPRYCRNDQLCGLTAAPAATGGPCFDRTYCEQAESLGTRVRCIYSDFTSFERGPMATEPCPVSPIPDLPFCGLACPSVECPLIDTPPHDYASCVGVTEERSFGLCTVGNYACPPPPFEPSSLIASAEERIGRPLACAVFRLQSTSTEPYGWITGLEVCRQYKARFPEALDCFDRNQDPVIP